MSDFSIDLKKWYGRSEPSRWTKFRLWLTDSELHCVACYRYGRFADRLRARNPMVGAFAQATHRIWSRWNTNWHHCILHRKAKIGPGFILMHRTGVVVGPAEIGSNCVVFQNVTIGEGTAGGDRQLPRIGNNVWIGPGVTISGAITVGHKVTISAGTVLSKDVPDGCLVAGNPGRVIARDYDNSAFVSQVVDADSPVGHSSDSIA
jgi:serine O-acetyltransferase